ncbi:MULTISPECIES: SDR family oxidoreductase [Paenibacillus]|uniref:Short-chain dehydrogenase n=1 Tax=Paenibacillus albilobatus TaxID=2716884 RepID=A0A920CC67_9BACL|nr:MULTISPECIES: SDR family oxidoreductase [Paenibacillus]GIO31644.1 short-chain dehydrogenase [Paenibacillus albilobatus]
MSKLTGKTALVTGASRGIGRAVAKRLAEEGALVAVHYGSKHAEAEAIVQEIKQQGGDAFAVGADLRSMEGIRQLFASLEALMQERLQDSGLDILVNNAGVGLPIPIEETTEQAFDDVVAVNVKAPFFIIQQALPRLRDGGRIINLSSATTRISLPVVAAYNMTKGAMNALTLSLANQLGVRGITINAILPGFIETDMNADSLATPEGRKFGADFSIFGRWGQPKDIADIAAFLASEDSRWITGQLIDASGGSHL